MHGSLARAGLGRVSAALFFVLAGSLCMVSQSLARLWSFSPPRSSADGPYAGGSRKMGLKFRDNANRRGKGKKKGRNPHPPGTLRLATWSLPPSKEFHVD